MNEITFTQALNKKIDFAIIKEFNKIIGFKDMNVIYLAPSNLTPTEWHHICEILYNYLKKNNIYLDQIYHRKNNKFSYYIAKDNLFIRTETLPKPLYDYWIVKFANKRLFSPTAHQFLPKISLWINSHDKNKNNNT